MAPATTKPKQAFGNEKGFATKPSLDWGNVRGKDFGWTEVQSPKKPNSKPSGQKQGGKGNGKGNNKNNKDHKKKGNDNFSPTNTKGNDKKKNKKKGDNKTAPSSPKDIKRKNNPFKPRAATQPNSPRLQKFPHHDHWEARLNKRPSLSSTVASPTSPTGSVRQPGSIAGYVKAMEMVRRDASEGTLSPTSSASLSNVARASSKLISYSSFRATNTAGLKPRKASVSLERTLSPKFNADRRSSLPAYHSIILPSGPQGPVGDSCGFTRRRSVGFAGFAGFARMESCASDAQFTLCLSDQFDKMEVFA